MALRWVVRTAYEIEEIGRTLHGKMDGKPHTLELKPFHRPRTLDQNAKLHAMIRELAIHTGYSDREMKDIVKAEFGPTVTLEIGGRTVTTPKGTSAYNVEEMSQMIEQLHVLGAEVGCVYQFT